MKKTTIILAIVLSAVILAMCVIAFIVVYNFNRTDTIEEAAEQQTSAPTEAPTAEPAPAPTEPPTEPSTEPVFVEEEGEWYCYIAGELQTDTVVGSDEDGYYYVGTYGAVDKSYCNGLTIDDVDWIIIEGNAYKVETESDEYLFAAAKDVNECTSADMSREEKLKACFDHIRTKYRESSLHNPAYPPTKSDWYLVYAKDIFVSGRGDCYSFGAAYAYMARAIGYTESYACNSTGHGWSEVDEKVYDPEWSLHSKNYSYYAMTYDEKCDVPYKGALAVGKEYKRVKIEIHK